jgi:hypothetical protein
MNERKSYAVILEDGADVVLGKAFNPYIKKKGDDSYIRAKAIDPDGNYFQLAVDLEVTSGEKVEIEIQIPHEYIRGTICRSDADIRESGFV